MQPRSSTNRPRKGTRRGVAFSLALAIAVVAASSAFAAAHFTPGALYTSAKGNCTPPGGATCVFKFRARKDGRALLFVGKTVVDTWRCNGGGGEALLGGKKGEPIPRVNLGSGGRLSGSTTYRPPGGRPQKITVTGQLSKVGKGSKARTAATITFHSHSAGYSCSTPSVTLTAH